MKVTKRDDGKVDLVGAQGKTWELYFKLTDKDNNPINLTNAQFRGQIRKKWSDTNKIADWTCSITNATQGECKAFLTPTQTASIPCGDKIKDPASQYVYDFEIEFPDGKVTEIMKGNLYVEWEVTR